MDMHEAIKVCKAIEELALYLGVEFEKVASRICSFDDVAKDKINTAILERNKMVGLSVADRARMLGYQVVEQEDGAVEVSMEL